MIFTIIFLVVVGVGAVTAAILVFGSRKAKPGDIPIGCSVNGNKIQCAAFD